MRHSQLESILTAAIVDYCQKNELYLSELHIQGTVCISSDGTPTLITQLSEKVSTNNNRCDTVLQPKATYNEDDQAHLEGAAVVTDHHHVRDRITRSKSPSRKHRRRSDPGNRYNEKYINETYKDAESYRWAVTSSQVKNVSDVTPYPGDVSDVRPGSRRVRHESYHHEDIQEEVEISEYKRPKDEPLDHSAHPRRLTERYDSVSESLKHDLARSGFTRTLSAPVEDEERRREQLLLQPWRSRLADSRVSATAMAVYAYMQSPTYQPSNSPHHSRLYHDSRSDDPMSRSDVEGIQGQGRDHDQPPAATTTSSTSSAAAENLSGNPVYSSPPPQSPHSTPDGHHSPNPHPSYMSYRRDLPLHIPGDYSGHPAPLSPPPPINIKPENREELHIVTRPMAPHVPGMVSPSAQAAASAMAALSSLQASIMPSGPPSTATATKTSPSTPTVGTSAPTPTTSSHNEVAADSSMLESVGESESESPEPSETSLLDMTGLSATGCLQIPDAPVNSHFRKMMLKSLQGKYKVLKTAEGRYKCPVCGVSYVYQPNLRKHLEKVHLGKSYKCEFCGQKFTSVQGYSFHRKVKHRELMPYRCELCRDAFYSYTAFLQHKKRSHSNHPECIAVTHTHNLPNSKAAKSRDSPSPPPPPPPPPPPSK